MAHRYFDTMRIKIGFDNVTSFFISMILLLIRIGGHKISLCDGWAIYVIQLNYTVSGKYVFEVFLLLLGSSD